MAAKTINGLAIASVKTVNGTVKANVKTWGGVALVASVPDAFFAATGITDGTIQSAITTLYDDLVGYSLWSKIYALWPFVGGDATKHSYNLVDTAQYQLTFNGGWTHASTGALPNGTDGYADTGFNPSTAIASAADFSLGMYSRTQTDQPNNSQWDMGVGNTATGESIMGLYVARPGYFTAFDSPVETDTYARVEYDGTRSDKFFVGTVRSTNDRELYRDGASLATLTTNYTTGPFQSANMWLGNCNPFPAGLNYWSAREFSLAFVAEGLTDTEVSNFTTAVNTFQTALSRNV